MVSFNDDVMLIKKGFWHKALAVDKRCVVAVVLRPGVLHLALEDERHSLIELRFCARQTVRWYTLLRRNIPCKKIDYRNGDLKTVNDYLNRV